MEAYIKLSGQTAGKDKLARLAQYTSKLLAFIVEHMQMSGLADQLKHLEFHLSSFRKLLRLGKCIEVFLATAKTLHLPDIMLRTLLTLTQIAQSLFLLTDHIIWIGRVGLVKVNNQRWNELYNRCWFYAIALSLLRDLYEIKLSLQHFGSPQFSSRSVIAFYGEQGLVGNAVHHLPAYIRTHVLPHVYFAVAFCLNHKHLAVDTLKNGCDVLIPLANLGRISVSPGIVGILGIISSLAGITALVDPTAKMAPM